MENVMRAEGLQKRNAGFNLGVVIACLLLVVVVVATPAAHAQNYSVLHSFTGTNGDGANPEGGVVMDSAGNLYGSTLFGGGGYGTVFKIDTAGNETIVHTFNLTDGSGPTGTLAIDAAGNLYGITGAGGALSSGTVFKIDTAGNFSVLYNVPAQPRAGLALDTAGNIYGTTFLGGDFGDGTVFKLDTTGTATVLHSFGATASDGILPTAKVTLDAAGNIYGTTENGGAFTFGTVYKIDTAGNYSVVHSFNNTDGAFPQAGVILDAAGNQYGTTFDGGANGIGAAYRIDTAGNLTVLHSFTAGPDGAKPACELVRDAAGNLYGTTAQGDAFGAGNVFKLDTAGNVTSLHTFSNTPDGSDSVAGLLMDASGNFYGTTYLGGAANDGLVFKLTPPVSLNNFTASVLVDREDRNTAVAGGFTPSSPIDPSTQAVSLSVAGTHSVAVSFAPGSFHKVLGAYVASATVGTTKVSMLLAPLKSGNGAYSAVLHNFLPGANPVTVSLTVGTQTGSATVNAHVF